jgi:hypothetical protein
MEFKEKGKNTEGTTRDTLYFNAFTEDLFHWNNDLENDTDRYLIIKYVYNFLSFAILNFPTHKHLLH